MCDVIDDDDESGPPPPPPQLMIPLMQEGPAGNEDAHPGWPSEQDYITSLPRLRELILEYASFKEGDAERLLSILQLRQQLGLSLTRITFPRSFVPEDERTTIMPRLQEIVQIVDWTPPDPDPERLLG